MENSLKAYVTAIAEDSDLYIPNAEHIERNDDLMLVEDDEAASRAAEQDGVKLVYGMEYVPDGVYLDTAENRAVILQELERHPEYKNVAIDGCRSTENEANQDMGMCFGKG